MPAHHVDLLTGMGPAGPRMLEMRRNPLRGRSSVDDMIQLRPATNEAVLREPEQYEAEFGLAETEFVSDGHQHEGG
jgi:hypothetical protein